MMFQITTETFPTVFRGTIYGISNTLARVGGILAPMIPSLVPHFMYMQGSIALLGFLLSFLLIETKKRPMEDELE